jgi:hypothetical protein
MSGLLVEVDQESVPASYSTTPPLRSLSCDGIATKLASIELIV